MPSTRRTRRNEAALPAPQLKVYVDRDGDSVLWITYSRDHSICVYFKTPRPIAAERWGGFAEVSGVAEPGYDFPLSASLTSPSAHSLALALPGKIDFRAASPAPLAAAA